MQEILLQAAAEAGAEAHRGATVRDVKPGAVPTVVVDQEGHVKELHARLVVGADGRTSMVRKWGGFTVHRDPPRLLIAGVLFEGMAAAEDTAYMIFNPGIGQTVPLFPQGGGRVRAYLIYQHETAHRLQGEADIPRFIAESIRTGVPAAFYAQTRAAGPLATFERSCHSWVEHPYRDGIALSGRCGGGERPRLWRRVVVDGARRAGPARSLAQPGGLGGGWTRLC